MQISYTHHTLEPHYQPSTKMIMSDYFLDLQAINQIFIEIIISYLGERLNQIPS